MHNNHQNNGQLVAILPEQNYFIFNMPNNPYHFGLIPTVSHAAGNANPTILLFNENNHDNTGKHTLVSLCNCNQEASTWFSRVTTNSNTTIIQTDKHFIALRTAQNPVVFSVTQKDLQSPFVSSATSLHEQGDNYCITYDIMPSNATSITHAINAYKIEDPSIKKPLHEKIHNFFNNINRTALLACHPSKQEIAFKRFNDELCITSTHSETNRARSMDLVDAPEAQMGEKKFSYQLIKYSCDGKFIVFLYPCAIGIYDTETKIVSYVNPRPLYNTNQAYHYISMAFYLHTHILALLNRMGNIDYVDIETALLYTDYHAYGQVHDVGSIRDNLLLFSKEGKLLHATISNHLVRYIVPTSIAVSQ